LSMVDRPEIRTYLNCKGFNSINKKNSAMMDISHLEVHLLSLKSASWYKLLLFVIVFMLF
jgi:hypothetical protein